MKWEIIEGECLEAMLKMPGDTFDAVITDPPYSSGGAFRSDRMRTTGDKYQQTGAARGIDFDGDNRDQRSWAMWCTLWLGQCYRVAKRGSFCVVFTDWRQLPSLSDAYQAAGFIWRGVFVWDKTDAARPFAGRPSNQCEYAVWGTKGPVPYDPMMPVRKGCVQHPPVHSSARLHQTEKPLKVMKELVALCPEGGTVFDPFCGSGTTLAVAVATGRNAVGVEVNPEYAALSRQRIEDATNNLFPELYETVNVQPVTPDMFSVDDTVGTDENDTPQ